MGVPPAQCPHHESSELLQRHSPAMWRSNVQTFRARTSYSSLFFQVWGESECLCLIMICTARLLIKWPYQNKENIEYCYWEWDTRAQLLILSHSLSWAVTIPHTSSILFNPPWLWPVSSNIFQSSLSIAVCVCLLCKKTQGAHGEV